MGGLPSQVINLVEDELTAVSIVKRRAYAPILLRRRNSVIRFGSSLKSTEPNFFALIFLLGILTKFTGFSGRRYSFVMAQSNTTFIRCLTREAVTRFVFHIGVGAADICLAVVSSTLKFPISLKA